MRVIVCGSRKWKDGEAVRARLAQIPEGSTIVHGDCPTGADRFAAHIANTPSMTRTSTVFDEERHPALWSRHGRKAGPLRNQRMADLGADLCIAFVDRMSGGTWDMVKRARNAGIPVEIIYAEGFDERE